MATLFKLRRLLGATGDVSGRVGYPIRAIAAKTFCSLVPKRHHYGGREGWEQHSLLLQVANDRKKVLLLVGKFDAERRLPRKLVLQITDLKQ